MKSKRQHELNLCSHKSVLSEGKSPIPPLFNSLGVLSSASDESKLFAKSFSKNCLEESVSLYLLSLLELIRNYKICNSEVSEKGHNER